ncbi:MAG: hypothetical protein E7665_08005 [Ruminococcaceae bacterium]|nr:hypothetical protein [Oscillospiraceae bacterium]
MDSKIIFFKIRFNNFRDVSASIANEVTDREEWDTCECVLSLPGSYSDDGDETPLILSCHGAGSVVCEESGQTGGISYCSECASRGYAVLDVCGSQPHGLTMGCPEHIFALHKAYLYAVKHYNLSKRVLVAGASMGGHTAMNFAHTFPGIVSALGLIYPRLNMDGVTFDGHYCIGTWDKTSKNAKTGYSTHDRIVQCYRFTEDKWQNENTIGFNPYLTRSYIGSDGKRVVFPPCPIKVWQGLDDTTVDPVMTLEFVESVRRSGSYIELHCLEGVAHRINDVMKRELAMWFDRFI